jgi:hypothetical protein
MAGSPSISRLTAPPRIFARGQFAIVWSSGMAKEELMTMEGQIDEILPDGRFGVMLDNEHRIIAYTAGKMPHPFGGRRPGPCRNDALRSFQGSDRLSRAHAWPGAGGAARLQALAAIEEAALPPRNEN